MNECSENNLVEKNEHLFIEINICVYVYCNNNKNTSCQVLVQIQRCNTVFFQTGRCLCCRELQGVCVGGGGDHSVCVGATCLISASRLQ